VSSYDIAVDVTIDTPEAAGVLFAHGCRFGGHALCIKGGKLKYDYNYVGEMDQYVESTKPVPTGECVLSASFEKEGDAMPTTGTLSLFINDEKVGEAKIKTQPGTGSWPAPSRSAPAMRPPAASIALAERCLIAIQRRDWHQAEIFADQAHTIVQTRRLDDYVFIAPVYAAAARTAVHRGEVQAAQAHLARAARLRPQLTYATRISPSRRCWSWGAPTWPSATLPVSRRPCGRPTTSCVGDRASAFSPSRPVSYDPSSTRSTNGPSEHPRSPRPNWASSGCCPPTSASRRSGSGCTFQRTR
jgi:hypothetical protein